MRKFTLLLFFFVIIKINNNCCAEPVSIIDSAFSFTDSLNYNQIGNTLLHHKFVSIKDHTFNFGLTLNTFCYVVVKIKTNYAQDRLVLLIDNTSIDTIFIFKIDEYGNKKLVYNGGNLIKYDLKRRYVWHSCPIIADGKANCYLIAIKAISKNVNVNYKVFHQDELQRLYMSFDRLIFFYIGIVFLIVFASLFGLIFFKASTFVYYTCYILFITFWILAHYGYLYPFCYASYPSLNHIVKPFFCLLASLCFLNLITISFKEKIKGTKFERMLYSLKIINSTLLIITPLHLFFINFYEYAVFNITWNVLLIITSMAVILTILWLYKNDRTARIFSFAIIILLLAVLLQIASNSGFIKNAYLNDHGILLGNLFENLILTFGIFYQIGEERKLKEERLLLLEEEQKKALQMLVYAQDNERKRIAEDLHDSIGPMLAAIKINFLRMIKAKTGDTNMLAVKTESIIDDSITEIRNISHRLMPKSLSSKGLINLLSDYFTDLEAIHPISIAFKHEINKALTEEVQLNLYRIISELVLNAIKHSCSKTICISVKTTKHAILISIEDNGKGFDPSKKTSSLGIKNVESRVNYLKGTMNITSSADKGTSIEISIPYEDFIVL